MLADKHTLVIYAGKDSGKTMAARLAILKHLLETGAIEFPKDANLYQLLEKHQKEIDAFVCPKLDIEAFASPPNQPPPLGAHTAINLATFDQYHGNGWRLNLITGEYEQTHLPPK